MLCRENVERVVGAGLFGMVAMVSACGPTSATGPDLIEPTHTGEAFGGMQCSSVRPPTEPDLMGWDSGSRANLKSLHEQGVVAVRYRAEGCNVELEVLDCVGAGTYELSAYSASETKIAKSVQELYAELPIGAAKLGGKVGGGRALRTDYMLAGVLRIPVMQSYAPEQLRGNCARATHVVGKLYIGGFAMASGESEQLSAGVSLFGVGAGASSDRSAERIAREGNAEACEAAQQEGKLERNCSVPLRVGLVPITGRAEGGCAVGSHWDGSACVQTAASAPIAGAPAPQPGWPFPFPSSNPQPVAPAPASPQPGSPASAASGACPKGMAGIPGGSFTPGHLRSALAIQPFCLDVTEVTADAYAACVKSGKCSDADLKNDSGCTYGVLGKGNHPINCVTWNQAKAYCEAQSKRLPTEEEWEWAARGGREARIYPWGNAAPDSQLCWSGVEMRSDTCAVASFPAGANRWGVHDLAGNVSEWTESKYDAFGARVSRGGSFNPIHVASDVRAAAARNPDLPSFRRVDLGFRCAR